MLIPLSLLLVALLALRLLMGSRYKYWKLRNFPYLEPSFPFGNLAKFCTGKQFVGEAFKEIYDRFKGHSYVGIFQCFTPVLVVRDPEEIKNILTKDFDHFNSRDEKLDGNLEFMSSSLFHMQDRGEWKFLRSRLTKSFSSSRMKQMFEEISRCTVTMMKKVRDTEDKGVEIKEICSDYTTEVSFSCFFGMDIKGNQDKDLREVREAVAVPRFTTRLRMSLYNFSSWLPVVLKVRAMPKLVNSFFMDLANEIIRYRETSGICRKDMFDELLQTKKSSDEWTASGQQLNHNGGSWTVGMETIGAQCFLFYAASYDTSSFTMSACLRAMAEYPEIQRKVHKEIDRVLENHSGVITYEAIQEMTYLDQVVAETLRLMPPVPELARKCTKQYRTREGLVIEAGVRVVIPVYAIQRDEEYYPDPQKFDPERFGPDSLSTRNNYTYLPFGEGPRSCLGMRFGLLQTKIGLATILREYRVNRDPRHDQFPVAFSPNIFVVSVCRDGFWVKMSRRNDISSH